MQDQSFKRLFFISLLFNALLILGIIFFTSYYQISIATKQAGRFLVCTAQTLTETQGLKSFFSHRGVSGLIGSTTSITSPQFVSKTIFGQTFFYGSLIEIDSQHFILHPETPFALSASSSKKITFQITNNTKIFETKLKPTADINKIISQYTSKKEINPNEVFPFSDLYLSQKSISINSFKVGDIVGGFTLEDIGDKTQNTTESISRLVF